MAKKRAHAADLRYGTVSRDDLDTYQRILTETAADLATVTELMATDGLDSIRVDGITKFPRGQQLISEFIGKIEIAVARAKNEARAKRQRDEMGGSK